MSDFEKVESALDMALREHNDFMRLADLPTGSNKITEAIEELKNIENDLERAWQALECRGVTRERAKTIANGIDVLETRYRKDINAALAEIQSLKQSAWIKCTPETMPADGEYVWWVFENGSMFYERIDYDMDADCVEKFLRGNEHTGRITHWRKAPVLPEEEDDE